MKSAGRATNLAHETGYDLQRLFDYVREREREAAARGVKFVSAAPREDETACTLREGRKDSLP